MNCAKIGEAQLSLPFFAAGLMDTESFYRRDRETIMAKDNAKKKDDAAEEKEAVKPAEGEDGEQAEGAEGAAKPKKSKKKLIIFAALGLLILIGAGAGAYFAGLIGGHASGEGEDAQAGNPADKIVFYTLPDFLVNLNTGSKSSSFLKATVILEVAKQEDVPLIEANIPRLMDAINTYLRELRASDLSGSAGIQRLREELLIRANKSLAPVKVNDVLFKEIVVQ
jgi:flagellar FliL protein